MVETYTPEMQHPRCSYARRTLQATLESQALKAYPGEVYVHIADDGSPDEHATRLCDFASEYLHVRGVTTSNSQCRGYGANYNQATHEFHWRGGLVLVLEDDWELTDREFDLNTYARVLQNDAQRVGCIRLGYIGFTAEFRCSIISSEQRLFLLFDPDSSERHVFSGHPRLESVAWQRYAGLWPEGLNPGATEFAVAGNPKARHGVVWPIAGNGPYAHIGTVTARSDKQEVQ
jgi:hypothetical protein